MKKIDKFYKIINDLIFVDNKIPFLKKFLENHGVFDIIPIPDIVLLNKLKLNKNILFEDIGRHILDQYFIYTYSEGFIFFIFFFIDKKNNYFFYVKKMNELETFENIINRESFVLCEEVYDKNLFMLKRIFDKFLVFKKKKKENFFELDISNNKDKKFYFLLENISELYDDKKINVDEILTNFLNHISYENLTDEIYMLGLYISAKILFSKYNFYDKFKDKLLEEVNLKNIKDKFNVISTLKFFL